MIEWNVIKIVQCCIKIWFENFIVVILLDGVYVYLVCK